MMKHQFYILVLFILVPTCCLVMYVIYSHSNPYTVQVIHLDTGENIVIIAEPQGLFEGVSTPLYYEIESVSFPMSKRVRFGSTFPDAISRLRFQVLSVDGGKLIALYEQTDPLFLYMLYASDSGEHWPCPDGKGGFEAIREEIIGDRILDRIRTITHERRYKYGLYGENYSLR